MRYNVSLNARNGGFSELLRVKSLDPDSWTSAFVVWASYNDGNRGMVCEQVDKDFPVELLKYDSDWISYMKEPRIHAQSGDFCSGNQADRMRLPDGR